jgi:hypothetical protein
MKRLLVIFLLGAAVGALIAVVVRAALHRPHPVLSAADHQEVRP